MGNLTISRCELKAVHRIDHRCPTFETIVLFAQGGVAQGQRVGREIPWSHEFFVKMFVIALPRMPVKWITNSDSD